MMQTPQHIILGPSVSSSNTVPLHFIQFFFFFQGSSTFGVKYPAPPPPWRFHGVSFLLVTCVE